MKFRRKKAGRSVLDMSPLIDCVLQLLIFFMLSSTFASPKIEISLPQAEATNAMTESKALVVTAAPSGDLYVDAAKVAPEHLEARLRAVLPQRENRRVTFRGHELIPYKTFVAVLSSARRAGASHVDVAHTQASGGATRGGAERDSGTDSDTRSGRGDADGR